MYVRFLLDWVEEAATTFSAVTLLATAGETDSTMRKASHGDELDEDKKAIEQSRRALPKNLIRPLPMQDHRG